jgi:VanZ like family
MQASPAASSSASPSNRFREEGAQSFLNVAIEDFSDWPKHSLRVIALRRARASSIRCDPVPYLSSEEAYHGDLYAILRSNWFPILWLVVILGLTLIPLEATDGAPPILCVLCGDGALADGVLNAALFLPLGASLSVTGWRPWRLLALGALLSLGVETFQFVIPGRDPSLSDVLFNTLGTALGSAVTGSTSMWWRPGPRLADILGIVGALGAAFIIALTGVLLGPSFPADTYYGGWTPRFGHLEWYGGRVLQASLDGLEIPPGVLANSPQVRQQLLGDAAIHVLARAGPRPLGLAPLFTIHDRHQREILLLGVDGEDIVIRYRTRAVAWGFIGPEIRAQGALRGIGWREPLTVIVHLSGCGYCVSVNATEHCGLGYTIGTGWALLLGNQPVFLWLRPTLNVAWLVALFFPTGLWARFSWAFAAAAALSLASLLLLPRHVGLLSTPWLELFGALAGLLAGRATGVLRLWPPRSA